MTINNSTFVRDWDPLDSKTFRDPLATYTEMRKRCPVAFTDRWGSFWTLTKYQDIVRVAADNETFISSIQNLVPMSPRSGVPRRPLQVDPPEHAQFRRAINPYLEPGRVAKLEPTLRQIAARFLQPLVARGRGDATKDYARHLPIRALCAFLGASEQDAVWIQERSGRYVQAIAADDRETAKQLSGELDEFALGLVATRRSAPLDPDLDLITGLFAAKIEDEPLNDEVIAGLVRGLIVAADRSTSNGIGSSILHLTTHADLQAQLRRDYVLIPEAVEEFVRLYAPSQATARTTTRDVELGGRKIRAGDVVAMVFLAGNRDPAVFPEPDECVFGRNSNLHLGFGHGVHKCAGQSLARLQLKIALEELLSRTKGFELDGSVVYNTWPEFGPKSLPIRFLA